MSRPRSFATAAVRAGIDCDSQHGAVTPPLHLSSNFSFDGYGGKRRYDYTRSGNPTRDLLAEALAELEGGAGAVVTASGMAAITTVLALLEPDDLIVVPHDGYGGSWRLFTALARKRHFRLAVVDFQDPVALGEALARRPRLLWIETPSNPLLRLTDIRFAAEVAHRAGALVCVDNTFLSPALQQPITLGADLVVHSTTKYINGHSDVVGGAVIAKDAALHEQLAWWANALGVTGSPFDSLLTLRGLRTLPIRLRQHEDNACSIAERLQHHHAVSAVHYPGLGSHRQHALAGRQQSGFGAIVSLELEGGERAVRAFIDGLRCFTLAESLGGVESLVAHPASMTHAAMSAESRAAAGISDGLLRLSVGIEDIGDLLADLDDALGRASATPERQAQIGRVS
ncbi:cystathionine gamma-synthase [Pseudofulvimonas gallinarii]|jgi:cystathionine gamma-synthase|uniref:Cystathionine gamma-synthase n=1 Tax=Pseudofulvimonas gallinarii TaxID=634155 RepID=A0A4S3KWD5_9GAMM|nr:cystathionine gamma-synthase [Pseudofulvimonas gallinarii]TCT00134.1 cystathionine gamma-synthase [Pseudofulvimonas gallinarii]THD13603.1 O-succinylhomoserine (thiol)-lyase [Pseudofulvimonas gallinarii]